ncbi:hypothetical protein N7603_07545 [Acholeplasma vituli]|uniref:Uncharacterized protein n=1 Tax=Paracholeplasma vituli TaxID=69473 RepID=A0ABT2PX30_9MOLU|nr:hypothetical protein [Paracholeplasma vituli]MCU0105510.1 hypothetical protein [Paracholeplasma vituli]
MNNKIDDCGHGSNQHLVNVTNDTPHCNAVAFVNVANPTDAAWWTTNLNNIATSDLWVVDPDGSIILALLVPQEIE